MPFTITPAIPNIVIGALTITHADWENNTPGTISSMANALSAQQALLSLVGVLTKAITGNTTLSAGESANIGFIFTGALAASAAVTFAAGFKGIAAVVNSTTGGFSITCGLAAGSTIAVPPGGSAMLFCDATNFILLDGIERTSTGSKVLGALEVTGNLSGTGITGQSVSVTGGATVGGGATVTGNITGAGITANALGVTTTATITGALTASSTASVAGAATVTGALTGGSTASIAGAATIGGALTGATGATISGGHFRAEAAAGDRRIVIKSPAGSSAWIEYDAATERWLAGRNSTAETGSNVGSDYEIVRSNDAGTPLGIPLRIMRANGWIVAPEMPTSAPTLSGALWSNAGVVTRVP